MIYTWDTQAVLSNETGTGWTLDVTAANLSTDLDEKDFQVSFDGVLVDTSLFTKLSKTVVRYDGAAVGSVAVELRRNTEVEPFRLVNYSDVILSGDYNRNLERYARIMAELRLFGNNPIGVPSIVDTAYGPVWSGDTINGAARSVLYSKFEAQEADYIARDSALETAINDDLALKAPLASPNFTGTPTAPTRVASDNTTALANTAHVKAAVSDALLPYATETYVNNGLALKANLASPALTGSPTAPTPPVANDSTRLATTQYVRQVASEFHAWVTGNYTLGPTVSNTVQTGGTATIRNTTGAAASYNSGAGEIILPVNGVYRLSIGEGWEGGNATVCLSFVDVGGSPFVSHRLISFIGVSSTGLTGSGTYIAQLNAGDRVRRVTRFDYSVAPTARHNGWLEAELLYRT